MSNKNAGSCLCGKIKFDLEGSFESFFLCHCKYCQKDTGSAHAANLFTTNSKLSWLSGEDLVKTFNLPQTRHVKSFCTNCGSAVPSIQNNGDLIVVPAGSLDVPVSIKPNAHLFIGSKANWEDELDELPSFEGLPR
ncbi:MULTISPECIES: GFA family protein [Halobacteriovorax]|uniref:GFA family protein n=1 Tax=Halobacteriovorax vibrionivorans TaxID=2152716 RepID=A0ABY0IFI4_9BACT|nr:MULTISPECIES: GFA family protein [Halobacteriovorax]RZF21345.1 GFA family protein [Halobacteriovorax vibrionivorans]TGD47897.1 GFA family protein [Halobacteriovorax sp. Y22]